MLTFFNYDKFLQDALDAQKRNPIRFSTLFNRAMANTECRKAAWGFEGHICPETTIKYRIQHGLYLSIKGFGYEKIGLVIMDVQLPYFGF